MKVKKIFIEVLPELKGKKFQFNNTEEKIRIPHMGWNLINIKNNDNLLIQNLVDEPEFYFVHSYRVICNIQILNSP